MDTCGDASIHYHVPEILAKLGYSASGVQAARHFYNGQLTPGEITPTFMNFSKAYFYHISLLGIFVKSLVIYY